MSTKRTARLLWATPLFALPLAWGGGAMGNASMEGDAPSLEQGVSMAHAIVTCQRATTYAHYAPSTGPKDPIATLPYGDKISIREDVGYPSWAVIQEHGPGTWGYLQRSCYTRCNGLNKPIPGCF